MKVAVIGIGNIGRVHCTILKELGFSPVLCDIDPARRGENGYADWRDMLKAEHPDTVHVCTPHDLHADMVVGCLEAGANVLCEKPLCIRREDIGRILEAERRAKGILGVCLQNRYNASSQAAKAWAEGKHIVSVSAMHAWRRDKAYYAADAWRGKQATEGGGVLINQALHTVDLVQWLSGMPERVSAQVSRLALSGVIETEDTAFLRMTGGGATRTICATTGAGCDFPPVIFMESADGERAELLPDKFRVNGTDVPLAPVHGAYGKDCYGASHRVLIEHFYDCIKQGTRFPIGAAEGAKCVRLILAAYESGTKEVSP